MPKRLQPGAGPSNEGPTPAKQSRDTRAELGSRGVQGLPLSRTLAEIADICHHDRHETSSPLPSCDQHTEPFSIFCIPCKKLICNGCLTDHQAHPMSDIQTMCDKQETQLVQKTEECGEVIGELTKSASGWKKLENDVKQNAKLHKVEIEKAYSSAVEELNNWRVKSLAAVTIQEEQWTSQCEASSRALETMAKRIMDQKMTSDNLISSADDTQFVKDAGQLTTEIESQLIYVQMARRKQAELKVKVRADLDSNPIFARHITVTAKEGMIKQPDVLVAKPEFKFIRTDGGRLTISDGGSVISGILCTREGYMAWTDGCFQTGRVYWEVEVSVPPSTLGTDTCGIGIGVNAVREGRALLGEAGRDCRWMTMYYYDDQFSCESHQGGEVTTAYQDDRHSTGAQRLGVFLDCEAQTLTFIDCDNNRVMCTVSGVCVSGPGLSPAVGFYTVTSGAVAAVSVRLVTGDRAISPQVLSDILQLK